MTEQIDRLSSLVLVHQKNLNQPVKPTLLTLWVKLVYFDILQKTSQKLVLNVMLSNNTF